MDKSGQVPTSLNQFYLWKLPWCEALCSRRSRCLGLLRLAGLGSWRSTGAAYSLFSMGLPMVSLGTAYPCWSMSSEAGRGRLDCCKAAETFWKSLRFSLPTAVETTLVAGMGAIEGTFFFWQKKKKRDSGHVRYQFFLQGNSSCTINMQIFLCIFFNQIDWFCFDSDINDFSLHYRKSEVFT